MAQRLFKVSKVGVFVDGYTPAVEKRRGEEVKVLRLSCRVAPFDAKLATSVDDGVGEESNVRATLFRLNHPDPKPHLDRVNFALGCPRQNLTIFASSDTVEPRLLFEQVRITDVYARTQKDRNGFDFCFKATLGPVGRSEQEYIHEWYLGQRFVTFDESEPSMAFESDGEDEGTEADQKARAPVVDGRVPRPMWQEPEEAPAKVARPQTRRPSARKPAARQKGRRRPA